MRVCEILSRLKRWVLSWFAKRERHGEQSNGVYDGEEELREQGWNGEDVW